MDEQCLNGHKAHGAEQQPHRRAALTPGGQLRTLVRVFGYGRNHRAVGAIHQAVAQAKQHKEHRGERRFHRQAKVVGHKLRRRDQRHRDGGVENERPEFSLLTDIPPGVQQHAGQHVGKRGEEFRHQENNAAIERGHAQFIGVKLQQIQRANTQHQVRAKIAHPVGALLTQAQFQG